MYSSTASVLLCGGRGSRMSALTSTWKCALPVANRPLMEFSLDALTSIDFKEVHCIVPSTQTSEPLISSLTSRFPKLKLWSFPLHNQADADEEEEEINMDGTFTAVLACLERTQCDDVLILSADSIVPPNAIRTLFEQHYTSNATASALFAKLSPERVKNLKREMTNSTDFVALSPNSSVLAMVPSMGIDDNIRLRKTFLRNVDKFELHSDLLDMHVYLIKKDVFACVRCSPLLSTKIQSIKYDLMPFLMKTQYREDAQKLFSDARQEFLKKLPEEKRENTSRAFSSIVTVQGCIVESTPPSLCTRVNTYMTYTEASREIARGVWCYLPKEEYDKKKKNFVSSKAIVNTMTAVGQDCIVGEKSEIGAKCAIRSSVIGKDCKIGDNCKILNTVLMDNVIIEEGVSITNGILCSNTIVHSKSAIINSTIGFGVEVKEKSTTENQVLTIDDDDEDETENETENDDDNDNETADEILFEEAV